MPSSFLTRLRFLLPAVLAASLATGAAAVPAAAAEPAPTATAPAAGDGEGDPEPVDPSPEPTAQPTDEPVPPSEPDPTPAPTDDPTVEPSPAPDPTVEPTPAPSADQSPSPSPSPSDSPSPGPTDPPPGPTWSGRYNLYRSRAWVRQYWDYTCTAASTQTMLNLILGDANRSSIFQQRIIRYARRHDTLRVSKGSDPEGWAAAMRHFGGGPYAWRVFPSRAAALRYAATRMVATGKPVGLLVWRGRHAWTMTGFTSATDPALDPDVVVTGIYVAPPLRGVDPRPNSYLRTSTLDTFARYRERDGLRAWINRWVVVAP
jgi:hypothetical protein